MASSIRVRSAAPIAAAIAAAVATFAPARPARADIVNVQSALATEPPPGGSLSLTGSADWRTGNTDLLVLSASPIARYRIGDHRIIAMVSGELGLSGGARIVAKTFEHLRYRYLINHWLLGETFVQHEYDQFRRLELRALVGAGPEFTLLNDKRYSLGIGVAYMLEYELLSNGPYADSGATDLAHRISSYVVGRYQLGKQLEAVETVYAQPRITEPADSQFLSESELVVKVTKVLAITTSFSFAYDTRPPEGVKSSDTELKSAFTYAF